MSKKRCVVCLLTLFCFSALGADLTRLVPKKKQKELSVGTNVIKSRSGNRSFDLRRMKAPKEVPGGAHVKAGKAAEWTINKAVILGGQTWKESLNLRGMSFYRVSETKDKVTKRTVSYTKVDDKIEKEVTYGEEEEVVTYHPRRWHIGAISGELDSQLAANIDGDGTPLDLIPETDIVTEEIDGVFHIVSITRRSSRSGNRYDTVPRYLWVDRWNKEKSDGLVLGFAYERLWGK
jgi:hypothetical protein